MLVSTERLQKTSERLQLGKQQLAETEVGNARMLLQPARGGPSLFELPAACLHMNA